MWYFGLLDTLWLLAVVALVIWAISAGRRKPGTGADPTLVSERDKARDARWLAYIGSFRPAAESDHERRIIDTMLAGGTVEDLDKLVTAKPAADTKAAVAVDDETIPQAVIPQTPVPAGAAAVVAEPARSVSQPLDGTLLLLYFGAFLFVASAGLFVAFGEFSGLLRTLLVVVTMLVLYAGGLWLHGRTDRLKPAGISFVAISLAIVPLVGVAAYNYLSTGLDARAIWLATSLLGLALYSHALYRLRTTFLAYLTIFSFVSLFESGIAVVDASAPYFLWGLIVIGLLARLARLRHRLVLVDGPAEQSARILVPAGTFLSVFLLADHGTGQLSVALALAAAYYAVEAYAGRWSRSIYVVASQVLAVAAVAVGVYALTEDKNTVAAVLIVLTVLHAILLTRAMRGRTEPGAVLRDVSTVAFGIPVVASIVAMQDGILLSFGVFMTAAMGGLLALSQRRTDAYTGGVLALTLLPYTVGQAAVEPHLGYGWQSLISFIVVAAMMALLSRSLRADSRWREPTLTLYAVALGAAVLPAWLALGWTAIAGTVGGALAVSYLAWRLRDESVWVTVGVLLAVPVILTLGETDRPQFTVAVTITLLGNLALAWARRSEVNRWLATATALVLPVALGGGGLGMHWPAEAYAYAYLAVTVGLVACRGIALQAAGRAAATADTTAANVDKPRRASLAYAAGYVSAAVLSVVISLTMESSQLHTSLILGCLLALSLLLSQKIESRREILAFVPWLSQALLLSALRPGEDSELGTLLVLISSLMAAGLYLVACQSHRHLGTAAREVRVSALYTAYLPLLLALFNDCADLTPPAALAVAGALTLHYNWRGAQSAREISGAILVAALMWSLVALDVTNLQVHTHILAAMFAVYAYWRFYKQDRQASDGYLYAMFFTATVPLVLQALGSTGGLYGWWLILQQVFFMIVGVSIGRRFLTWWGLYVSVAAVMYQLRNLGWAALTVLAVFVIGVAVYRLMRTSGQNR